MAKKENKSTPSKDFLERKELIDLDLRNLQEKHKLKMKELEFMRESDRLHHERELERGRIKTAEIRKTIMRKQYPYKF